jgi:hypothetical protein
MNGFLVRRESGRLVLFVSALAVLLVGAGQASAATLNVCPSGCPYTQIAPAVAAAKSGDTIKIAAGTYSGGITIDVSVKLIGAGPGSTIISGGGPVLTIGVFGASSEPTVSIDGVKVTGGVAHSSPESTPFVGEEGVIALGGGVEIPPNADFSGGATVTITHSVITGNRAAPTHTVPFGPPCPGGPCPFALARGGGIDNWGTLTLAHTTVSDNEAAGVASDAVGGGISSVIGSVTLTNTRVTGNQAVATIPNGRFAEGGGIFVGNGAAFTVRNSVVNNNSTSLTSTLPSFAGGNVIDMNSNSGGIHVGDGVPTTVDNTEINGNSVTATDLFGEPNAFDAAMLVGDSPLTMRNCTISGNQSTGTSATSEDVGSGGSALELDGGGTIKNTRITDNTATAISPGGVAAVNGGLAVLNFDNDPKLVTMQNGVISGNTATASSTTGSATAEGGGIFNNSLLELRNVQVSDNSATATGPSGVAQGGGIWNGVELSGPPVELTLENTTVTRNTLNGSPGVTVQGGGLFTTLPVTLTHSLIALNTPDQCFGC